ncbi:HMG domain-containing protein 3 isoform 1-T3 [Menidia menidia]
MDKVELLEVVKSEEVGSNCGQMEVAIPKKRKSKAQDDCVERPKKPRSAYLLYYFDVHQIMQLGTPNMPQSEVNKRISESWKRLSVAEKSHYLERAKLEKDGIDTSSLSSCKHLPGFRKILPRASCFLLPKGSSINHQPGGSQPAVSDDSVDMSAEGCLSSVSLVQESQFTHLGVAGEVDLSEHHIVADHVAEETPVASPSMGLQGCTASSSSKASIDSSFSQASADFTVNGFPLNKKDTKIPNNNYNGAATQQGQRETTQVVAIVPSQNLLESKSVAGIGSLRPVMMISLGAKSDQSAKPSYKMSVKTYTRRGRGKCLNPGCSFVYVTRHKPPTCPECGSHLGGKWIPAAKRTQEKGSASKQLPQRAETKSKETRQAPQSSAQGRNTDSCKTKANESNKERQVQRCSQKQSAALAAAPPEGSSTKLQTPPRSVKDNPKSPMILSQNYSPPVQQKRPVRPILPALYNSGGALIQILTVPPDKEKFQGVNHNNSSTAHPESFSGLKPSTLKQLGQAIPPAAANQDSAVLASRSQPESSLTDRMNVVSVVPFKQHPVSSFDLGLSTARGKGRCKNPSCDYMYKNRHKPAVCPKCGCELTQKNTKATKSESLLDPYQALSPAQRDIQRQSTVQLLRSFLQIPESETELQETLSIIQELNSLKILLVQAGEQERESTEIETVAESGWPQFYENAATHCSLCNYPLFKGGQSTVAGQEDCWLLTETLIQTATVQLKVCLNVQCLALHSFTDLHPGLFNVGNKLLVSIDLFLKIRANIRLGFSPSQAVTTLLDHSPSHPVHALSLEESSKIHELLLSGYWAFECLTVRDYNDMICGICGIAPKVEIAQRDANTVLELKNVEFTWPEGSVSDEVLVDDFWLTMESEAIEQAAFPTDIPITRVDASIIAPFIPSLMRGPTVINTEKDKVLPQIQQPSGDPSVLVRLIHDGQLRLDKIEDHNEEELRAILDSCGANTTPSSTKNELLASLIDLYTHVHSGLCTAPQPPAHLTAGKLSKVCPHKVVCSSKCLVRGETARDHMDLLLSSRHWPPVYVCDSARKVALCTDLQYPELAIQMWGRNQGCFSDPFENPEFVSCAELQDHPYSADLSLVAENQPLHPITKSSSRWLVGPPGSVPEPLAPDHHSMLLCSELEPYLSLVAEVVSEPKVEEKEGEESAEQPDAARKDSREKPEDGLAVSRTAKQSMVFNNTAYYYLYNRLVDFLTSRDIVGKQINEVVKACQPGEVVIRDALYRLGVAQIKTEKEEDEIKETEEHAQGEVTELHEIVLSE